MMQNNDEKIKNILVKLGQDGAKEAANALSEMIFQEISIEIPRVHIVSPIEVPNVLDFHDFQTVIIIEQLSRNVDCDIILVFTIDEAKKLAKILLESVGVEEVGDFEVLEEIGNILIGNFINTFSNFTGATLKPNPPRHIVDYFEAILDTYVTKLIYQDRRATLFDTKLTCSGTDINGMILMFLSEEFQEKILSKSNQSNSIVQESMIDFVSNIN